MRLTIILLALIAFLSMGNTDIYCTKYMLPAPPDSTWFDFWKGDWNAHWFEKDSLKATGENSISTQFGGSVIQEKFKINSGISQGFEGGSWSVFDHKKGKWFQTWVDSQGSYMAFEGGLNGYNRYFERDVVTAAGKTIKQRMVFKDIKQNSFTWDWESSSDGGKTWQLNWQIFYTRK